MFYQPNAAHRAAVAAGVAAGLALVQATKFDLDTFTLFSRGGGGTVDIAAAMTSAELELTVEGASTLTITVADADHALLTSGVFTRWTWGETGLRDEKGWVTKGRAVDAYLAAPDGTRAWFRLVKVSKADDVLTLTFEDRIVSYLRAHKGTKKLARSAGTRAMFIRSLAREVNVEGGIATFIPELSVKQPIAKKDDAAKAKDKKANAEPGIAKDAKLKVQDANGNTQDATPEQIRNMERVLAVAESVSAPPKATLALVEACMIESGFRNLSGGDASSTGILQVLAETARGIPARVEGTGNAGHAGANVPKHTGGTLNPRDVEACAYHFLTAGFYGRGGAVDIARKSPSQTAGWVAQQTQGSAFPDRYDKVRDVCQEIVDAYTGGGGRADGEGRTYTKRYEFTRGKDEDSWTAMGRLAEEVAWRAFVREGRLWYVSEEYLFRQRAAMTVKPRDEAVLAMDFELDLAARYPVAEVTLRAMVADWEALPGMVVVLKDAGPVDGRWLVTRVRRSLYDQEAEVTLSKPVPAKPEPRSQETTSDGNASGGDAGTHDADASKVERVYAAAVAISDQDRAYVYGGGHGKPLDTIQPHEGLDCSSSSALALKRGGLYDGDVAQVSGWFARSWGLPGEGKYLTVWANDEHVWVQFKIPGKKGWRLDTSSYGSGGSGPHVRFTERPTAGFNPRHWPGT